MAPGTPISEQIIATMDINTDQQTLHLIGVITGIEKISASLPPPISNRTKPGCSNGVGLQKKLYDKFSDSNTDEQHKNRQQYIID